MLEVFNDTTNISQYVERNSYSENFSLNNRRDTAKFMALQNAVTQGQSIYIYDALHLSQQAASGQAVLNVLDPYEDVDKFRAGDTITVYPRTANERTYVIDSIDPDAKTVTLTENLAANIDMDDVVGKLRMAGVVNKAPQTEIGVTGTFDYRVDVADWGVLFNRKNVRNVFENMWSREIIGRVVYDDVAVDSQETIDYLESAWTEGGVGLAMADETTDRIQGQKSQKTGTSGVGTATWTQSITATDISGYKHARFWWKVTENYGQYVSAVKLRVGQDASNYYEYNLSNIGEDYEDCWNYDSVILNEPTTSTGTPNLTAVDWIQLVVTCTAAIPTGNIIFDHMTVSIGGFTIQNVTRGLKKFTKKRANYIKPTVLLEDLHKQQSMFWYIDVERDVNSFQSTDKVAPFSLTDSSENYADLVITPDITKLTNRQTVRGGEAPSETQFTEQFVADGVQTTWNLAYKPDSIQVYVDTTGTGSSYVEKTIGVENFADESVIEFVYAFLEKTVRNAALSTLAQGTLIKFVYYPYLPIRAQVQNYTSITSMAALTGGDGIYDGEPIVDLNIKTYEDARLRAQAEIDAYSNPIYTATFTTEKDGLRPGQTITITDTSRGITSQEYLIQSVRAQTKNGDRFKYSVVAGSTMYGIIEFLQWLIKKQQELDSEIEELVDIVVNDDEVITITQAETLTQNDPEIYAGVNVGKRWDFVDNVGTISESGQIRQSLSYSFWYADFQGSEAGTAEFDKSTNHNNGTALKLTTTVGGDGNALQLRNYKRIYIRSWKTYTFYAWVEILSAFTNVDTGGGLKIELLEYDTQENGTLLATNTLVTGYTTVGDFVRLTPITITPNGSTNWVELRITLDEAIGVVSIADVVLEDTDL